ncbi:multiubiquitin domain-containing protein [Streptomyces mirabilis]|uniref:multiubiquitin domain-containing protein n=1 Tax=Streptomyces mirabilis TaxID=68239 RepID=UPI0036A153CA
MHDPAGSDTTGHPRTYEIVVNGSKRTVTTEVVTFEQAVSLAFAQVPTGPNVLITVSYRHAHQKPAEGTLTAGAGVHVKNGTVLSVTATDKS